MIGLDKNVLVRYIVRDDDEQSEAATRLIESKCTADNPGLVSSIVMCELAWQAVRLFEQGKADFADYLIGVSNREGKAEVTYTFDRRAVESDLFKIVPTRI